MMMVMISEEDSEDDDDKQKTFPLQFILVATLSFVLTVVMNKNSDGTVKTASFQTQKERERNRKKEIRTKYFYF